jgi:hypothetical protein
MLKTFTKVTVSLFGAVATSAATLPTPSFASSTAASQPPYSIIQEEPTKTQETATKEVAPEKPKEMRLVCNGCNSYETKTLKFLQDQGITDKNALATIMGNIRQESTFFPNICEGGARVSYESCRSGGYGLIQWTDSARYYGLGRHAYSIGANPSSIDAQLDYMMNEGDWKMIEPYMKKPGQPIEYYMRLARKWIRWGHHGARTNYAYDYSKKLVFEEVQTDA